MTVPSDRRDFDTLRPADLLERLRAATEWRAVPDWPYEASNTGVLRSAITGKPLSPSISQRGYARVTFQHDLARMSVRVHRAVYEAWFGYIPEGPTVNHLNGDKLDNRPVNLEVCTSGENTRHAATLGLTAKGERNGTHTQPHRIARGSRNGWATLTESKVAYVRQRLAAGATGAALARELGVSENTISGIKNNKWWRHV